MRGGLWGGRSIYRICRSVLGVTVLPKAKDWRSVGTQVILFAEFSHMPPNISITCQPMMLATVILERTIIEVPQLGDSSRTCSNDHIRRLSCAPTRPFSQVLEGSSIFKQSGHVLFSSGILKRRANSASYIRSTSIGYNSLSARVADMSFAKLFFDTDRDLDGLLTGSISPIFANIHQATSQASGRVYPRFDVVQRDVSVLRRITDSQFGKDSG